MKRIYNIIGIFLVVTLLCIATVSIAQTHTPPPPRHGMTDPVVPGGSAPVGEGIALLVALGAAYGIRKVYHLRRKLAD